MRALVRSTGLGQLRVVAGAPAGIVSALVAVTLTSLLIAWIRSRVDVPNLSMLYLLAVLALGSVHGRAAALIAAVTSFLTFNYFFVDPVWTFHVADPQEWLALIVLLLTALVTGHLAAALRARAREAEAREREVVALYECSRLLEGDAPVAERLAAASRHLADFYAARGCEVLTPDATGRLGVWAGCGASGAGSKDAEQAAAWAYEHGLPASPDRHLLGRRWVRVVPPRLRARSGHTEVVCLPVAMSERRLGVLRLVGYAPERLTSAREMHHLRAVAGLIAQTVERERLAAEALEADVLRRADEVKTALLASVSHDLRTPLASIKASVTNLLDEAIQWPSEARRELLRAVDEETDRLTRFVAQLLDLSRLDSGAAQPRKDWLSIEEVLVDVGDRLDPLGARVQVCIADAPPLMRVDYVMVEQIIGNLVDNALRYSPGDAPVDVRASTRGDHLIIEVADVGPGVATSERERVFDRFYRSAGSARSPGTGLGLAIARGFSRAHGGDVEYAPNPGGGSIFRVILPLDDDAPERHRS